MIFGKKTKKYGKIWMRVGAKMAAKARSYIAWMRLDACAKGKYGIYWQIEGRNAEMRRTMK
jgi:hypothetical protein